MHCVFYIAISTEVLVNIEAVTVPEQFKTCAPQFSMKIFNIFRGMLGKLFWLFSLLHCLHSLSKSFFNKNIFVRYDNLASLLRI